LKKPDLADLVQEHFEANRRQALDFVDVFFDTITNAVASGDKVSIAGFGIWEKKNRPARMALNPMKLKQLKDQGMSDESAKKAARVKVAAKTVAKFRPAADFKAIVLGGKKTATKAKKAKKTKTKKTKKTKKVVKKTASKRKSILGLRKKTKKRR
jgi:DNA-binding protein HU-beta